MTDDLDLRRRLAEMESRVPASPPPALPSSRRHYYPVALAVAVTLILGLAATALAGGVLSPNQPEPTSAPRTPETARETQTDVTGYPGIENSGQPLAGARMECMTPRQAADFLASHGYTDVVWQIETGSDDHGTTTFASIPPEHGYVIPGGVLDDGKLHMFVDQRAGTQPRPVCGDMPMP